MLRYQTLLVAAVFAATAGQVFAGPFGLFHRNRHCRPAPVCPPPPCPPQAHQVPYCPPCPPPVPVLLQWECTHTCNRCLHSSGEDQGYVVGVGYGGTEQEAKDNAQAAAEAECESMNCTCTDVETDCFDPGGNGESAYTNAAKFDFPFDVIIADERPIRIVVRHTDGRAALPAVIRYLRRTFPGRQWRIQPRVPREVAAPPR